MSTNGNLGQKNPLLQRVRRHKDMAMLFRSVSLSHAPVWTAEIVNSDSPPTQALPLPQETMETTRPFSPQTSSSPQPIIPPPTMQRQTAVATTTPSLWQRAKTIFRKETAPAAKPATESITATPTVEPSTPAPSHQPPAPNSDTYSVIQRQTVGDPLTVNSNPLTANREMSNVPHVLAASTPMADTRVTAVSQSTPSQSAHTAADTYATIQRQPTMTTPQPITKQSPISNPQSPLSPSPHRPPTSDSNSTWSPLQAIYNAHHVADNRQSATPIQRQAATPAVPTDGSFPWGALQNIYNVHQKVEHQENAAPTSAPVQRSEADSAAAEPHLPEQAVPLQAIWPVEKTVKPGTTAVSPTNPTSSTTPIQRTATDQAQDAQVRAKLNAVTPARPSDSSVELVTPRRPRPTPPGAKTVVQSQAVQRKEQKSRRAGEQGSRGDFAPSLPSTTVETEIGPLPADLWDYISAEPPASAPAATPSAQSAPVMPKPAVDTAVQRAIAQAETPTVDDDAPLTAASLIPISNEPAVTAVPTTPPTVQRQAEPKFTTRPNIADTSTATAVAPPPTMPRKEQSAASAIPNFQKQSDPISPSEAGQFTQPSAVNATAPDIQRAIFFAEASPVRQGKMVSQAATAEPAATANHPQASVVQQEIDANQTAVTTTAVTPRSETNQSPISNLQSPHFPTNTKIVATATAVTPTTPAVNDSTVQRSAQRATNQSTTESNFKPTPFSRVEPIQKTINTTAVSQPTTVQRQTAQTTAVQQDTPDLRGFKNLGGLQAELATSAQPDVAQAIAQAEAPTNGRFLQRQTEPKTAVHHNTPNLSGLTEPSQHTIAEAAPVTIDQQTSHQPPATQPNGTTKQTGTLQREPAANNQIPPIQRTEAETADAPNLQSPISDLITNHQPPTTEQPETAVTPDIDELARQVYSDLKRRLSVEWERTRGRIIT